MGSLVHTGLGSSSLVAHVLHYPPPTHANSVVMGTAVINTHIMIACSRAGSSPQKKNLATHQFMERNTEGHCDAKSVIYPLQSPSQSSHSGLSNFLPHSDLGHHIYSLDWPLSIDFHIYASAWPHTPFLLSHVLPCSYQLFYVIKRTISFAHLSFHSLAANQRSELPILSHLDPLLFPLMPGVVNLPDSAVTCKSTYFG